MPETGAGRAPAAVQVPASRLSLAWYWLARWMVEIFCRTYFRVEIKGPQHVPSAGPYVIAPVHRSIVDTLLAGCLTRRRIRFMGKDSLWKYGWAGSFFSSLGAFPVHRGTPDREALRRCEEALRAGEPYQDPSSSPKGLSDGHERESTCGLQALARRAKPVGGGL